MEFLGLTDPMIIAAYLSCIIVTIICIVYGAIYWNSDK